METFEPENRGRLLGIMTCLSPGCGRKFRRWENVPAETFEALLELHLHRHRLEERAIARRLNGDG